MSTNVINLSSILSEDTETQVSLLDELDNFFNKLTYDPGVLLNSRFIFLLNHFANTGPEDMKEVCNRYLNLYV